MQLLVRSALPHDVSTIYTFLCQLSEKQYDKVLFEEVYLENLQSDKNVYLVAETDGKVVGFLGCHGQLLLHHTGWVYEIQEMFTDAAYRGRGIGKKLLTELESILNTRSYDMIDVTSNNKRTEAHRFYLSNGFTQSHQKFTKKGNQ